MSLRNIRNFHTRKLDEITVFYAVCRISVFPPVILQKLKKSISFYTEFHDMWLGEGPQVWIAIFGLLIDIYKGLSKVVTVNFLLTQ